MQTLVPIPACCTVMAVLLHLHQPTFTSWTSPSSSVTRLVVHLQTKPMSTKCPLPRALNAAEQEVRGCIAHKTTNIWEHLFWWNSSVCFSSYLLKNSFFIARYLVNGPLCLLLPAYLWPVIYNFGQPIISAHWYFCDCNISSIWEVLEPSKRKNDAEKPE